MAIMSRIETISKVSLKFTCRINLRRRGAHMHRALDLGQSPQPPNPPPPPPPPPPTHTHTHPGKSHPPGQQRPLDPTGTTNNHPLPPTTANRPEAHQQSATEAYQQIDPGRRGARAPRLPFWTQPTSLAPLPQPGKGYPQANKNS